MGCESCRKSFGCCPVGSECAQGCCFLFGLACGILHVTFLTGIQIDSFGSPKTPLSLLFLFLGPFKLRFGGRELELGSIGASRVQLVPYGFSTLAKNSPHRNQKSIAWDSLKRIFSAHSFRASVPFILLLFASRTPELFVDDSLSSPNRLVACFLLILVHLSAQQIEFGLTSRIRCIAAR